MDAALPVHSKRSLAVAFVVFSTAFFGVILTAPTAAAADQYVSGPIPVDRTWFARDNYFVTGHVTVLPGVTLTIEPDTHVFFDSGRGLFVEGTLRADGLPGTPIQFLPNTTILPTPWYGIQFNASSTGSVSQSFFSGPDRAVTAIDSSPAIFNNAVQGATWGFVLVRSGTVLADNVVDRAAIGVYLAESNAEVVRNWINDTTIFGIRAETSGSPGLRANAITNARGPFAVAIYTTGPVTPTIEGNLIQGIQGRNGTDAVGAGTPGGDGGLAIGILVDGGSSATVMSNMVDSLRGGRGGNGAPNSGGAGGRGGNGGSAAGIVVANVGTADVGRNSVTNLSGGRGGMGGQGSGTPTGGNGGDAGDAVAFQIFSAATASRSYGNFADVIVAGNGGHGGDGTGLDGFGGVGGDALGLFEVGAMNANASLNTIQNIRGGLGGNSTLLGAGNRAAGAAGAATAIALFGSPGSSTLNSNTLVVVSGGAGGRGSPGGRGGDGTGVLIFGNNDGLFNVTSSTSNTIGFITGGNGGNVGIGPSRGGDGGTAVGIGAIRVTTSMASNDLFALVGGAGGDGVIGGRGGDASGIAGILVRGSSVLDSVLTIFRGNPGSPPPAEIARGIGYYVEGNATYTARFTVDNATATSIGDYHFLASNYAHVTTINTSVVDGRLHVEPAGNLTVRNFLGVDAFWPNGITFVAGASIRVDDNGATAWNIVSASGSARWLLVTDRVYVNSDIATENSTEVRVTYLSYAFQNSPRFVDMSSTHTEAFVMVDNDAPASQAGSLPTYTVTLAFTVAYTATDGSGVGLSNISLWYRKDGSGGWIRYATQPAANGGSFVFVASADGTYEFQTIAEDVAGNVEPGPGANDTWTIVDTARPASHVDSLSTYQTVRTFLVSWAPDTGVTDIARYDIEYNAGSGWVHWLTGTTQTSAMFTAAQDGVIQFRSTAVDVAGNSETPPATNDTWTIVDTIRPSSRVLLLSTYQTSLSFVVSWGPQFDTTDIASYRIEVRDNGGPWTDWFPSTDATSSAFNGQDGHTYEFRSTARDRAGNFETTTGTNDTWTIVDASAPTIIVFSPSGTSVGTTSPFVITFSEPMNTTATEAAVSFTPTLSGAFSWNANRTVLTFVSFNPLAAQTQHTVLIGSGARDRAGNGLSQRVFQFSTASSIGSGTLNLSDLWWLLLVVGAVVGGALFLILRRRTGGTPKSATPAAAAKESEAILEDVFLLNHRDGVLIKHETRRLRPDVDTDILSGMLTAVQQFVKDALQGDDYADLNEMTVGHMHILIGRGKWLVLAARIEGDGSEKWTTQIERCIKDMEDHHWDQLEDWDGDMSLARVLTPYVKKLIQGSYASPQAGTGSPLSSAPVALKARPR